MQDSSRTVYKKQSDRAQIGGRQDAHNFSKTLTMQDWVPTVVNPADQQSALEYYKFYLHLGVWVISLILSMAMNFRSKKAMEDKREGFGGSCTVECYTGISDTSFIIAILGAVSTTIGVSMLLFGVAWFPAETYKKMPLLNTTITLFTVYGMVSSYYTFMHAAAQPSHGYFVLALFTVIFQTYAQILLYCTSASLNVLMLPRAFLPSIGASIQFISAIAISSGDFKALGGGDFTKAQKTIAWLVPVFTFGSLVLMLFIRRSTRHVGHTGMEGEMEHKDIGNFPFLRSLVLSPFVAAGMLGVYKLSFMTVENSDPSAYMFALAGALFNFVIISVVFVPGANAFGMLD